MSEPLNLTVPWTVELASAARLRQIGNELDRVEHWLQQALDVLDNRDLPGVRDALVNARYGEPKPLAEAA